MKITKIRFLFSLFVLTLLYLMVLPGALQATATGLLTPGALVTASNNSPTLTTIFGGLVASGPTSSTISLSGYYTFSFTDNTFTYDNTTFGGVYSTPPPGGFNGFVLSFTGIPIIASVVNDPTSQLDPNSINFTNNSIWFDVSGLNRSAGQKSVFDVTFGNAATTPEPASLLLLGSGLLGLAGAARRKLFA